MERKIYEHCEIKSADDTNLILEHFISTATEDSGGDIMEPDGMVIRGKPVVLFQHGQDPVKGMEPIAKPVGLSVGVNEKGVKGIIARTQYFPDEQGKRLYKKAKEGYMPNWSIGYKIDDFIATPKGGRHVKKWQLMEYSQVAVGMNSEATVEEDAKLFTGVKVIDAETKSADNGRSRKRAHKVLKAIHERMIDDMKEAAAADTFVVDGAEKSATNALEDFTESSKGHISSYIKAAQEMDGNEPFEEEPDDSADDSKGYQKCRKELVKCRKELVKAIQGYKCNKTVKPEEETEKCSTEHTKKALPHAIEFVKEFAKKVLEDKKKKEEQGKAGKPALIKSIAEKIDGDQAERNFYDKTYTVHHALIAELIRLSQETQDEAGKIVGDLLAEYNSIISPYMVVFANEIRTNETLKDKYKEYEIIVKKFLEQVSAVDPAPRKQAAVPPAQEKVLHIAGEESYTVPKREELETSVKESFVRALGDELTRAIRKLQGRLD